MLGSNIKFYRLKKGLTIRDLASKINISPMALSYYENNKRRPNKIVLSKIVESLNINLTDLLTTYDTTSNNIINEDYLYNKITKLEKEYIDVQIIDYISRYFQILSFASLSNQLLIKKDEKVLEISQKAANNASELRKHLQINPIESINLIEALENNNIILIPIKFNSNYIISTGKVNDIRYISYNINLSKEILYKHITYLLIEIFFKDIAKYEKKLIKDTYLEFLLPKKALECIIKYQKTFNEELKSIQKKYSISLKDYLYYLKREKIYSGNIDESISKSKVELPNRFNSILNQIYTNNYIDERKYYELKKSNMLE